MASHLPIPSPKVGSPSGAGYIALTNAAGALDDWHQLADFSTIGHLAIGADAVIDDSFLDTGSTYEIIIAVAEEFTDLTTSDYVSGVHVEVLLDPAAAPSTSVYGSYSEVRTDPLNTENFAPAIFANQLFAVHNGSGVASWLYGQSVVATGSNGDITNCIGSQSFAWLSGTAGASSLIGFEAYASNYGTGTVVDARGISIKDTGTSGTITDFYGLHVEDQSGNGVNSWNIFSAGATAVNEFEGAVVVGGHSAFGADAVIDDSFLEVSPYSTVIAAAEEFTTLTAGTYYNMVNAEMLANPDANTTANVYSTRSQLYTPVANNKTFQTMGAIYGSLWHRGAGNVGAAYGLSVNASANNALSTVTSLYAGNFQAYTEDADVTNLYGVHSYAANWGGGTVTNAKALWVSGQGSTGTITNAYGLYVDDLSAEGATSWNIFSAGATAVNEFEGDVVIGADLAHEGSLVGFFGTAPVAQQSEITDELTTITFTAPGTPDYAIQDLIQPAGFGFATKDEGNSVLAVIANLQTRVNELETVLAAYGLVVDAD